MILPSKHLSAERSLLTQGARVLHGLSYPQTVSALWENMRRSEDAEVQALSYDAFVLTLDLLYLLGALDINDGLIERITK